MKYSKLMKERIHRTQILFRELGYEIVDPEESEGAFTASSTKTKSMKEIFSSMKRANS
jgi:hypothetical protein